MLNSREQIDSNQKPKGHGPRAFCAPNPNVVVLKENGTFEELHEYSDPSTNERIQESNVLECMQCEESIQTFTP